MERRYYHEGREHRIAWRVAGGEEHYVQDGRPLVAEVRPGPDGTALVRFGKVSYRALVSAGPDFTDVCIEGHRIRLEHRAPARSAATSGGAAAASGRLASPMTGKVRRVLVEVGQGVAAGATLVVVEAMKMEFPIRAPFAGQVGRLHLSEGDAVEMGAALVDLVAEEAGGEAEAAGLA